MGPNDAVIGQSHARGPSNGTIITTMREHSPIANIKDFPFQEQNPETRAQQKTVLDESETGPEVIIRQYLGQIEALNALKAYRKIRRIAHKAIQLYDKNTKNLYNPFLKISLLNFLSRAQLELKVFTIAKRNATTAIGLLKKPKSILSATGTEIKRVKAQLYKTYDLASKALINAEAKKKNIPEAKGLQNTPQPLKPERKAPYSKDAVQEASARIAKQQAIEEKLSYWFNLSMMRSRSLEVANNTDTSLSFKHHLQLEIHLAHANLLFYYNKPGNKESWVAIYWLLRNWLQFIKGAEITIISDLTTLLSSDYFSVMSKESIWLAIEVLAKLQRKGNTAIEGAKKN